MKPEDILENPNAFIKKHNALAESNALLEAKSDFLQEQTRAQAKEIRQLKAMMAQSLYGRKSERDINGQLGIPFFADLEGTMATVVEPPDALEPSEKKSKKEKKKRKSGRTTIPEHLRRERVIYEQTPEDLNALFGKGQWREIGEEINPFGYL